MTKIAASVGCSTRHVYYSWRKYRKLHPEIYNEKTVHRQMLAKVERETSSKEVKELQKELVKKIKELEKFKQLEQPSNTLLNPENIDLFNLSDVDLRDKFIKFVGYVGREGPDGYAILDEEGEEIPGEGVPAPVDDITGEYMGIAKYQADFIIIYRHNDNILVIWPRGHGKTWVASWLIEFFMKYNAEKFLYFSLTDVAYTVADFVYIWADSKGAIVDSNTVRANKKISGRKSTYQKFSLINGARYEVHQIRTSTTLGYHGWNIIMDDIIDEQHRRLPHLQKSLQAKWNHQYSKIRRRKFLAVNTRKFPGDFFDYLIDQFEIKYKAYLQKKGKELTRYVLYIDLKTPYVDIYYSGQVNGYREFIKKLENEELDYDKTKLIAPWFIPEDLDAMKLENLKSFYAEMMGNPRPISGGNWTKDDLVFIVDFEQFDYEAVILSVDPAWTVSETSDESGISILGLKKKLYEGRRQYTVFQAYEEKLKVKKWKERLSDGRVIERPGLLDFIEKQFQWMKRTFTRAMLLVILETNSGGQVIVDTAKAESDNYEFVAHLVEKTEFTFSKMNKYDRIDNQIFDTIKNKDCSFLYYLKQGVLIRQILHFPDCESDHCIDSMAKGKFVLHSLKRQDVASAKDRVYEVVSRARKFRQGKAIAAFEREGVKGLRMRGKRRGIFQ